MLKKNFTLCLVIKAMLLLVLFTGTEVAAQKWVSKKPEKRKVVLEEFTGIHCGYCPDGHKIANKIAADNPNKVFLVNIHGGGYATPGPGEIDLRTPDGEIFTQLMRVGGFPTAAVNREVVQNTWTFGRENWANFCNQVMNFDAPVNIAVRARVHPDTRKLTAEVELYYTQDAGNINFITVVITQDNILGDQLGATTYYPQNMVDGKYKHNHVLRRMITPVVNFGDEIVIGDAVTQPKAGQYEYRKYEWDLPADIQGIPLVVEDLNVVAHVTAGEVLPPTQSYTMPMRIFNAASSKVEISTIEDLPKLALVEQFTNANSAECAFVNGDSGVNHYLKSNVDKAISIVYHTQTPVADPMNEFDNSFSYQRGVNYYNAATVPSVVIDGAKLNLPTNSALATLTNVEAAVNQASKTSTMLITPNFTIDESGKMAVNVEVASQETFTNLALRIVVTEAAVFFDKPAGTNGEQEFYFVARHMLPNATGTSFGIEANGKRNFSFEKQLDLTKLKRENLYVVVFVQSEADKKILQTAITKKLEFLSVEVVESGEIYSKVNAGSQKLHNFTLKNFSQVPITVTFVPKSLATDWEYSPAVSATRNIAAGETANIEYGTKCSSGDASIFASGYEIVVTDFQAKPDFDNGIVVYPTSKNVNFVDITNNAKNAYIFGEGICSEESAEANIHTFTSYTSETSPAFENIVAIPFYSDALFSGNTLDNFDFVAMTIDEENYTALIHKAPAALSKLTSLINADKKVYFAASKQFEAVAENKQKYPIQTKAITDFYKNQFGAANTEAKTTLSAPVKIVGCDDSPISKGTYELYESPGGHFVDFFTISGSNNAGIFKTEADNKIVAIRSNNVYDATKNRRILLGFDLAASLPSGERNQMMKQIVNWLFDNESGIDENETGFFANGIELFVSNNPITPGTNLTINNSNDGITNVQIYLLDVSGAKVADIYSGNISLGSSNFALNANIPAGKYFVIAETNLGKSYLPILVNK